MFRAKQIQLIIIYSNFLFFNKVRIYIYIKNIKYLNRLNFVHKKAPKIFNRFLHFFEYLSI